MARETAKGGIFTRTLLNQLTKGGDENRSMTYRGLIEKIREDGDFKGNG
jgi:hypothetical protein